MVVDYWYQLSVPRGSRCVEMRRVLRRSDCRFPVRSVIEYSTTKCGSAVSFLTSYDLKAVDASSMAQVPPHFRMQAGVRFCCSRSSVHAVNSVVGMTNHRTLPGRRMMMAYGQFIPIVGIRRLRIRFSARFRI